MPLWTFRDYLDAGGTNVIRQWMDSDEVPLEAAVKIDTRILFLADLPVWPPQYVSAITGWPDLLELRVVYAGNQYRPLGFYGPGYEFTIVHAAVEKRKLPRHVLVTATERMNIVRSDRRRSCAHEFRKKSTAG